MLSPDGLEAAKAAYLGALRNGNDGPSDVVARVLRAYLAANPVITGPELTQPMDGRISPISKDCAAMKVGDKIEVPAQPLQSIRQRFKTACRLMNNPDAKWRTRSLSNGKVEIERMADGVRYWRDPLLNAKAVELASLAVGQSIISKTLKSTRSKGSMGSNTKIAARRIMGIPYADWSVEARSKGVRLTRIK